MLWLLLLIILWQHAFCCCGTLFWVPAELVVHGLKSFHSIGISVTWQMPVIVIMVVASIHSGAGDTHSSVTDSVIKLLVLMHWGCCYCWRNIFNHRIVFMKNYDIVIILSASDFIIWSLKQYGIMVHLQQYTGYCLTCIVKDNVSLLPWLYHLNDVFLSLLKTETHHSWSRFIPDIESALVVWWK